MSDTSQEFIRYKRNRFAARFPTRYLYTLSHFWLWEHEAGCWRIGLTNFATRMLGEIVEFDFEVKEGQAVRIADVVGWIEGFKATSDLYCVVEGEFSGANSAAAGNASVLSSDPYGKGWLYGVKGTPDKAAVDVHGYIEHLGLTIDKMLEQPWRKAQMGET